MNWKETNMNVNSVISQKYVITVNVPPFYTPQALGDLNFPGRQKHANIHLT